MQKKNNFEEFKGNQPAEFCNQVISSWKKINKDQINVQNKSGKSGNTTYKVSTKLAKPSAIGLHVLNIGVYSDRIDPDFFKKQLAGIKLFQENNLTPKLWASGKDYFIVDWEGETVGPHAHILSDSRSMIDIALFIAKMHQLPNDWYAPFRESLNKRFPCFKNFADGSYFWWYVSNILYFISGKNETLLKEWYNAGPYPVTEAGKRLVTSTFDLHCQNIIKTKKGIKAIDFDHVTVNHAVQDFSWIFALWMSPKTIEEKRLFIKTYLEASNLPASEEDVDGLILDAEVGRLSACFWEKLYTFLSKKQLNVFKKYMEVVNLAYKDKSLANEIICNGIHNCKKIKELDDIYIGGGKKKEGKKEEKKKEEKKEGKKEEKKVGNNEKREKKTDTIKEKKQLEKVDNKNNEKTIDKNNTKKSIRNTTINKANVKKVVNRNKSVIAKK